MKPQDTQAAAITFGVELETTVPVLSGLSVGVATITAPLCIEFGFANIDSDVLFDGFIHLTSAFIPFICG